MVGIPARINSGIPTDEQIDAAYKKNPGAVREIVRKMYVIEHSTPNIKMPEHQIIIKKNGDLIVDYKGMGLVDVGKDPYAMQYVFKLQPMVKEGFTQSRDNTKWWCFGVGGALAVGFGLGFWAGWAAHKKLF